MNLPALELIDNTVLIGVRSKVDIRLTGNLVWWDKAAGAASTPAPGSVMSMASVSSDTPAQLRIGSSGLS
jgi:hypothetical protein